VATRIVDVTDAESFGLVPPCADPGFDHRSCDYWEEADRGSKAARATWLSGPAEPAVPARRQEPVDNPFAPAEVAEPAFNPFATGGDDLVDNPFAPKRDVGPTGPGSDALPKVRLLGRGLAVFGSYAKVLVVDDEAVAYAQFGPLSAYPRALRLRELYPRLPESPLPAVITCIATTAAARGAGHARHLVDAVCEDLSGRGFSAVEAYPEVGAPPDATSAATPDFWIGCGFQVAAADDRFPVVRRELT
jgi:hypothetical protein